MIYYLYQVSVCRLFMYIRIKRIPLNHTTLFKVRLNIMVIVPIPDLCLHPYFNIILKGKATLMINMFYQKKLLMNFDTSIIIS